MPGLPGRGATAGPAVTCRLKALGYAGIVIGAVIYLVYRLLLALGLVEPDWRMK